MATFTGIGGSFDQEYTFSINIKENSEFLILLHSLQPTNFYDSGGFFKTYPLSIHLILVVLTRKYKNPAYSANYSLLRRTTINCIGSTGIGVNRVMS